ncbi:aminoglycoside phosphotransferase family protein [Hoeflea sp. AS60]|uniref:aminoglycoside phosphotransferase family protein n=1 Tax=Hoeflea sp. AS60 TaxID=3135780 RepID=UPI00317D1A9E
MKTFDSVVALAHEYGEQRLEEKKSFDSSVFLGTKHVFKVKRSDPGQTSKERRVLDYVHAQGSSKLRALLPRVVDEVALSDGQQVTIQTRMPGEKVVELSLRRSVALGSALSELHALPAPDGVTEFEGDSEPSLPRYISRSADRFVAKLSQTVGPADLALAERARVHLQERLNWFRSARIVVVHKDIFLENLLFEGDVLTAIVDWDAAQTAPPEWEHSILRQRFPEAYSEICSAYDGVLSEEGINLCALLQSLRFWKSFPNDQVFADVQRRTITEILSHG